MRRGFRVATWEETLEYGAKLPRGLRPRIAGGAVRTLAVDASTVTWKAAGTTSSAVTTCVSSAFSPPAGSGIAVVVTQTALATSTVTAMTDSLGSHLSWSKLKGQAGNGVDAEVWWANCPAAQAGMTVTSTISAAVDGRVYWVMPIVFTGAAPTQSGATNGATSASGTPSVAVTTTRVGSRVLMVVGNFTNATGPTVGAAQTTTFGAVSGIVLQATTGDSAWVQMLTATTGAPGSVTVNDTAPAAISYSAAAVEILAANNSQQVGAQQATMRAATR